MTICVAAMCDTNRVFAASDRLITAGDIEFTHSQKKLYSFTTSILAMWSGDAALAVELLDQVHAETQPRVVEHPDLWWRVSEIAALYSTKYVARAAQGGERKFLAPLGLTKESFIRHQQEMAPELVKQLATELINFQLPALSIMFLGVDTLGPHIWVAHGGELTDCDAVGFAAIGSGYWHAESQLMFAGHSRHTSESKTLWMTYLAKKRAEVAPGVGQSTDLMMVGPQLGSAQTIRKDVLDFLEASYRQLKRASEQKAIAVEKKVDEFIKKLNKPAESAPQTIPEASNREVPPSQTGVH